jgi:3',5'-nucleoside bisphosphate phosphatase
VRIDLHTHSDRSDGTMPPREVVRAAKAAGLDVLGLTDHDTAEGWGEAAQEAERVGLRLVRGIEISCRHAGRSAHLLAYLPDPTHPTLLHGLDRILEGRDQRMPRVVRRLRDLGIGIDEDLVRDIAGEAAAMGRPHIADALVSLGEVRDRDEAFDRYLSPGRPGYVERYAADVEDMVGIVRDAGGVPVLAHPWGRTDTSALQEDGLARLKDFGLVGIEVDHQDHSPAQRAQLRGIAGELDLLVTGSSDFHGSGKTDHDLGCNTTDPEELERLLEVADRIGAAAGRSAPGG